MKSLVYQKVNGKYKKDNPEAQRLRDIKHRPRKTYISKMVAIAAGSYSKAMKLPRHERLRLRAIADKQYKQEQHAESMQELHKARLVWQSDGEAYKNRPVYPSVKELKDKIPRPVSKKNPEGFVYIFRDKMKPDGYYKIGSTHDLNDRLNEARTWCAIELVTYFETNNRKKLEKDIHNLLDKHNVRWHDLGKEWFKISHITETIGKIKELVNESFNHAVAS